MAEPQRSALQRPDGVALTVWDWPAPVGARGQVLLVHGLGEHARRYGAVACPTQKLCSTTWTRSWPTPGRAALALWWWWATAWAAW